MSLFALPVSLSDIENLQKGIEFQTNVPEATLEVGLINAGTTTVQAYANQLILNMAPLSQVVMAVDSLMSGLVQSEAEMTNLTVNFLPAQLAFFNALPPATQAGAGGAIVWDSEVTGFALTERAAFTTNFAGLNTGANAGTAGNAAFAAAVSTAIFGNTSLTTQVLAYLASFESYFTANPTALTGNGIPLADLVKAADAITFGTEVGIALSNPTTVGAFLEGQVTNALIANGEFQNGQGPTPVGVALGLIPAATPLQGAPHPTFTLTINTDTFTTGTGSDIYNALLAGPFGNENTLTAGDKLVDSGHFNTLNAFFNGAPFVPPVGLTIQGIQTWDFTNVVASTQTITGAPFALGGPGPIGGAVNPGVQQINFQNSVPGTTWNIGSAVAGGGIQSLLAGTAAVPAVNVLNNGVGTIVNLFVGANQWTAAPSTLVVATNSGSTNFDIGPDVATAGAGYVNWVVQDQDAGTDTLTLGAQGNANGVAQTLTITGANGGASAANVTLLGDAALAPAWNGLTALTGNVNGFFTVTGAETVNGLLSGNTTALASITDTGTGASSYDLSSMTNANMHAMTAVTGGAKLGFVELNNSVITAPFTTAIALNNIDDISDSTAAVPAGSTIDMKNFPLVTGAAMIGGVSFAELQFLTAASATTGGAIGTLTINNGLTDFFVQLNGQADGSNLTISAGLANLNGGVDALAVGVSGQAIPTFTDNNYTTTDLVVSGTTTLGSTNFIDNQPIGDPFPGVVNISGAGHLTMGNIVTPVEGTATVQINGLGATAISDTGSGSLVLGISNASSITYNNVLGQMIMDGPGTNLTATIQVLANSTALGSTIDGSMGAVTHIGNNVIPASPGNFSGAVGSNTITVGPGGDGVFITGPSTVTETAHPGFGDITYFGGYANINATNASITGVNPDAVAGGTTNIVIQEITDGSDNAYQGFWGVANGSGPTSITGTLFFGLSNGGTSADISVIKGFAPGVGPAFDQITFLTDAWSGGVAGSIGSLYFDDGATTLHNTVNSLAGTGTSAVVIPNASVPQIAVTNNFLVDNGVGTISGAATLALDLNTLNPFSLAPLGAGLAAGKDAHILVAYASSANGGGTTIADVDIVNTSAGTIYNTNAAGVHIFASDMVELVGITTAQVATANIHFA